MLDNRLAHITSQLCTGFTTARNNRSVSHSVNKPKRLTSTHHSPESCVLSNPRRPLRPSCHSDQSQSTESPSNPHWSIHTLALGGFQIRPVDGMVQRAIREIIPVNSNHSVFRPKNIRFGGLSECVGRSLQDIPTDNPGLKCPQKPGVVRVERADSIRTTRQADLLARVSSTCCKYNFLSGLRYLFNRELNHRA